MNGPLSEILEELRSLAEAKRATPRRKLRRFGKPNTERRKIGAQEARKHREAAKAASYSPFEQRRQQNKARSYA